MYLPVIINKFPLLDIARMLHQVGVICAFMKFLWEQKVYIGWLKISEFHVFSKTQIYQKEK